VQACPFLTSRKSRVTRQSIPIPNTDPTQAKEHALKNAQSSQHLRRALTTVFSARQGRRARPLQALILYNRRETTCIDGAHAGVLGRRASAWATAWSGFTLVSPSVS
jgi:hypothetical protein